MIILAAPQHTVINKMPQIADYSMIANAAPEPTKLLSPAEIQQQKLTIANLAQANRLGQVQVDKADDSGLVRSAVQKSTTIDPANKQPVTDHSAVVGALVSGGRGDLAQQYQSQVQQEQAAKAKQFYDSNKQDLSIMAQLINGVKSAPPEKRDQAYQTAKQQFTQLTGKPSAGVPDQWDDAWGDQVLGSVRSIEDMFKQQGDEKIQQMRNEGTKEAASIRAAATVDAAKNRKENLRPIPAAMSKAIVANDSAKKNIDRALALVASTPTAFGLSNLLGDTVRQRTDPGGVSARAAVADIGSLKIHDRSGAAVTASEFPRLKAFIPSEKDKPETIRKKLELFKQQLEDENEAISSIYAEDQGYNAPPKLGAQDGGTKALRQGGVMHEDANGNRAIVYPDGTIEEVE